MARAATPSRRPPSAVAAAAPSAPAAQALVFLPHPRRVVSLGGAATASACASGVCSRSRGRPAPPRERASACACSPTTHPGSFRCALHRGRGGRHRGPSAAAAPAPVSSKLSGRQPSMANPLVRIAAVEGGDHVRRALACLVRPPPSQRRRADAFRPRPSRLSAMSSAAAAHDVPSP